MARAAPRKSALSRAMRESEVMTTDQNFQVSRAVLALDPGGSKCEALLVRDDGTALSAGRVQRTGISGRSPRIIREAARKALGKWRVDELHLVTIAALMLNKNLELSLNRPFISHAISEIDGLMALADERFGIAVVAGTGARVSGINREGQYRSLDGLGPQLGDVGGGYQVGLRALRAAVLAERHPRHATSMRNRIFAHCLADFEKAKGKGDGCSPMKPDLCLHLRKTAARFLIFDLELKCAGSRLQRLVDFSLMPQDRSVIASLARIADEEAERGDAVALRILEDAAEGLAETVWDLVDLLGMHDDDYPLIAGGSLALRSRAYWRAFRARLAERTPRLTPFRAPWPPVVGNALVALLQIQPGEGEAVRTRLYESVRAFHDATSPIP